MAFDIYAASNSLKEKLKNNDKDSIVRVLSLMSHVPNYSPLNALLVLEQSRSDDRIPHEIHNASTWEKLGYKVSDSRYARKEIWEPKFEKDKDGNQVKVGTTSAIVFTDNDVIDYEPRIQPELSAVMKKIIKDNDIVIKPTTGNNSYIENGCLHLCKKGERDVWLADTTMLLMSLLKKPKPAICGAMLVNRLTDRDDELISCVLTNKIKSDDLKDIKSKYNHLLSDLKDVLIPVVKKKIIDYEKTAEDPELDEKLLSLAPDIDSMDLKDLPIEI